MDDLVRISSQRLAAAVSPLGAELRSLVADGGELMWSGDARWWGAVAPLLFPVIGRTPESGVRIGGRSYALPMHGFAQSRRFDVASRAADSVRFHLCDDADSRAIYPFAFDLSVEFSANAGMLMTAVVVRNNGTAPMPMCFGFHPGFRLEGTAECRLRFAEPEALTVRRASGGFLLPEAVPSPINGRDLALADLEFDTGAYIFEGLRSRGVELCQGDRPLLRVEFEGCANLALWSRPGAGFLCIEPWNGMPETAGFDGDLSDRPGIAMVAPGASASMSLRITVPE